MVALRRGSTQLRGIVTVEAAIVLPLIILLTMGLLEYGWLFLKVQHVTNAARQGARVGARADSTAPDIEAAVARSMTSGGIGSVNYELTIAPGDITELEPGEMLSVTVRVAYADIGLGLPLTPTPDALEATVVMAREGP